MQSHGVMSSGMKLLITSVGSLVGHGILDVLEYPAHSRRAVVTVIGTNSVADAANNFRCDRCYLAPQTVTPAFASRLREILMKECPDLILCGRDDDTLALSQLKAEDPTLPGVLPVGPPHAALIALDKWQTYLFTRKRGLPFAETFMPGVSGDHAALQCFGDEFGYPLIAKPARGFASVGVHFVRDARELSALEPRGGYLLQEYLGDAQRLQSYFALFHGLPPLFAQAPDTGHYSCMTVIGPTGEMGSQLCLMFQNDFGMATRIARVSDRSLEEVNASYARALAAEGVVGPVNVAFRRDRCGEWKAQEINLRNTGGTYVRFLMGFDEIQLIARAFVPNIDFPAYEIPKQDVPDRITRYYSAHPINDAQITTLARTGVWSRSA
jgi:carbamoylphosphate synthase large subunit